MYSVGKSLVLVLDSDQILEGNGVSATLEQEGSVRFGQNERISITLRTPQRTARGTHTRIYA